MMNRLDITLFIEAKINYLYSTTSSSLCFFISLSLLFYFIFHVTFANILSECKSSLTDIQRELNKVSI